MIVVFIATLLLFCANAHSQVPLGIEAMNAQIAMVQAERASLSSLYDDSLEDVLGFFDTIKESVLINKQKLEEKKSTLEQQHESDISVYSPIEANLTSEVNELTASIEDIRTQLDSTEHKIARNEEIIAKNNASIDSMYESRCESAVRFFEKVSNIKGLQKLLQDVISDIDASLVAVNKALNGGSDPKEEAFVQIGDKKKGLDAHEAEVNSKLSNFMQRYSVSKYESTYTPSNPKSCFAQQTGNTEGWYNSHSSSIE